MIVIRYIVWMVITYRWLIKTAYANKNYCLLKLLLIYSWQPLVVFLLQAAPFSIPHRCWVLSSPSSGWQGTMWSSSWNPSLPTTFRIHVPVRVSLLGGGLLALCVFLLSAIHATQLGTPASAGQWEKHEYGLFVFRNRESIRALRLPVLCIG